MKTLLSALILTAALHGQQTKLDPLEGLWQGFDGEWGHVSRQLLALASAFPPDKFDWRPGAGVRSTSEVLMHIVQTNYSLLSITGAGLEMPTVLQGNVEKTVIDKSAVIGWLGRSLDAVKAARANLKPGDLQRKVRWTTTEGTYNATVDGIYLRIIIHANEHMGQLVAYARMNGITPPWSETPAK